MRQLSSNEREQVLTFLQKSQKILAIKYIRNLFNYDLAEAKHDVEQLMMNPDFIPTQQKQIQMARVQGPYRNIELDHLSQELFVVTHDGERFPIDETHPEWHQIMLFFTDRQFPHKQDYLNAVRLIQNAEDLAIMQQKHQQQLEVEAARHQHLILQAIEAQDRKNNLIILMSSLLIVAICVMYFSR